MYARSDPDDKLRTLAELQAGVLTAEQATAAGVGPRSQQRLVSQGHWSRLTDGVFLVGGLAPDWSAMAWAGVLQVGDHARLGGTSAGFIDGLIDQPPEPILVLVPHATQRQNRSPWMFRRERPEIRQLQMRRDPPRTTIEDTVLDLCDPSFPGSDQRTPADWIADAVQQHLTTPQRLRRSLDGRRRHPRRRLLERLLDDVGRGAQSRLELSYLRDVERPHGLPASVRQRRTDNSAGRSFSDVRYEKYGVIVELDGETGHVGSGRFRDMARDNAALLDGAVTLRYGSYDLLTGPCEVGWQVGQLLLQRGWPGPFVRCSGCVSFPG